MKVLSCPCTIVWKMPCFSLKILLSEKMVCVHPQYCSFRKVRTQDSHSGVVQNNCSETFWARWSQPASNYTLLWFNCSEKKRLWIDPTTGKKKTQIRPVFWVAALICRWKLLKLATRHEDRAEELQECHVFWIFGLTNKKIVMLKMFNASYLFIFYN